MLQSGVQLLDRFAQDDRVRILQPRRNLQVKFTKSLSGQKDFVAYVDAIGELVRTASDLTFETKCLDFARLGKTSSDWIAQRRHTFSQSLCRTT